MFYTQDPNLDSDRKKEIRLPDTIDYLFDLYYALTEVVMDLVDSAISYIVSAVELFNLRKTLSLLAAFTSMETLVNIEFKNASIEKCEECGQQRFSIAKKFREFLLKYIGDILANKINLFIQEVN